MSFIIFCVLLIVVILFIAGIYNKLVTLKNRFQNSFAQIEVQLKRRYDLIPNLVEIAKGYMSHEKETLEAVISARNEAAAILKATAGNNNKNNLSQLAAAEGSLQSALGKLNVVMEAYPDLKASDNMMQLTEELTTTENRVSFARQGFNDAVMEYNNYKQSFPPVMIASFFGHKNDANLLEFADSVQIQEAPKVSF
ncbi:MAG: LemA protein [Pseudomonadales bacterium]|jgi:LemA protein